MPPITEAQLIIPALKAMAASPGGFITTADLISSLEGGFAPTGTDADVLLNRNDTHFSQKVRNLVSHRDNSNSLVSRGLATYVPDRQGWQITSGGLAYIEDCARTLL